MNRFYIAPEQWNPDHLVLDESETHHCLHVLRMEVGQRMVVFNGQGVEATAEIVGTDKKSVTLKKILLHTSPRLTCRFTLAQAIPKGKNMELIVQKATELGAAEIVPLLSERVVRQVDANDALRKAEKWQAIAIEAAKQCGQNWLPKISPLQTPKAFFEQRAADTLRLIASLQSDSRPFRTVLAGFREEHKKNPTDVLILVGPEGDFTPAEILLAKSYGCIPVSLGPIILRTETAALYCLSVLAHELL